MTHVGESPRITRERRTVRLMVELYCRDQHHGGEVLCDQCDAELAFDAVDGGTRRELLLVLGAQ